MVEAILLISSILFCSVSIYMSRIGIRESIQQRLLDIANCASGSVNGEVMKTLSEETVGSTEYNHIYDTLAVFRDNVELEYVYCIKEAEPGHFIFTMDLDQEEPASYGDDVKFTEALAKAGRGTAAVDEVPYTDKWGSFYSAYSPVFDSMGSVVGIVAVDFSVPWFEAQLSEQTRSMVTGYVIILIISLLVGALLALLTVRPYVRAQGELLAEKERYLSEGFTDYLTKPIDSFALEKILLKYLPEDKVEMCMEEAEDTDGDLGEDAFSSLRSVGIEPKVGLRYCQEDEKLYRSLLAEYAYGEIEKANSLQKSYEEENWHDYSIYVHSIKSSSKMIGATVLSAHAAKLEAAANDGDSETIRNDHDNVMEEYELLTAVIRSVIPKEELSSEDNSVKEFSSDDEIMEFLPSEDDENED